MVPPLPDDNAADGKTGNAGGFISNRMEYRYMPRSAADYLKKAGVPFQIVTRRLIILLQYFNSGHCSLQGRLCFSHIRIGL